MDGRRSDATHFAGGRGVSGEAAVLEMDGRRSDATHFAGGRRAEVEDGGGEGGDLKGGIKGRIACHPT